MWSRGSLKSVYRQLGSSIMLTIIVAVVLGLIYPVAVWGIGQGAFRNKADGSLLTRGGKVVGSSLVGQGFSNAAGDPLPQYFQPRPSDAGTGYDASDSAASNLGPDDPRLVGFIPGVNTIGLNGQPSKTNPFATTTDPYCVPLLSPKGTPVDEPAPGDKYEMSHGSYVCDPNTIPERTLAYRQFNGLAPSVKVPVDAVTASSSGLDPDISIANADLQAPRVARVRQLSLSTVMHLIKENTTPYYWGFIGEPGVNVLTLNIALDQLQR
jgi:potassium-transporting ATPase KdpC subunit